MAVLYAGSADDEALRRACARAAEAELPVTVAVPIGRIGSMAFLTPFNLVELEEELREEARSLGERAISRVPPDLAVELRLLPAGSEAELLGDTKAEGIGKPGFRRRAAAWLGFSGRNRSSRQPA